MSDSAAVFPNVVITNAVTAKTALIDVRAALKTAAGRGFSEEEIEAEKAKFTEYWQRRTRSLKGSYPQDPFSKLPVRVETYPEHEKLHGVVEESQAIGEFLEWLKGNCEGSPSPPIVLCEWVPAPASWVESEGRMHMTKKSTTQLLAAYFGIDQDEIDAEKDRMFQHLRGEDD